MPDWTEELRADVVKKYEAANPTPENTTEIVKDIAEALGEGFTPNGVRVILNKAEVYVKKAAATTTSSTGTKTPRVNKADAINELNTIIEANGLEVDADIIGKLTGKAAVYFKNVIEKVAEPED